MAPIYEKSTRLLMADAARELTPPFTQHEIVEWFHEKYPKLKASTVVAHVAFMTANNRNRRHHNYLGSQAPLLFKTSEGFVLNRPGFCGGSGYWFPTPAGAACWAA